MSHYMIEYENLRTADIVAEALIDWNVKNMYRIKLAISLKFKINTGYGIPHILAI